MEEKKTKKRDDSEKGRVGPVGLLKSCRY